MLTWRLASLLWVEHKFNCGIIGLEDFNYDALACSRWRKLFWIIVESLLERLLMMLAYRSAHAKQFLRMFRHEICGSEDCSKNNVSSSGDVDEVQWRSRFTQKAHNCWRIHDSRIAMTLKSKLNHQLNTVFLIHFFES